MIRMTCRLIVAFIFSCFSSATLSYIALTTQMGPWVGPTLALIALGVCRPFAKTAQDYLLPVFAGSLGGIIATAVSFSFPTLYFLDKKIFDDLLLQPAYFVGLLIVTICFVGGLVLIGVLLCKDHLLKKEGLSFPIGQLEQSLIVSCDDTNQVKQLVAGGCIAFVYSVAQQFFSWTKMVLSQAYTWKCIALPAIVLDGVLLPMYVAIGFSAGTLIAIPLMIGIALKIVVAGPLHALCFSSLSTNDFLFALSSGIVLSGAFSGMFSLFFYAWTFVVDVFKNREMLKTSDTKMIRNVMPIVGMGIIGCFLLHVLHFSWLASVYLLIFSLFAAYQIVVIAGKIGLALLGRFATYVLVPGALLFGYNALQITFVALFVELCGGIATDLMFSFKAAQLAEISRKKVIGFQLFGLVVGACATAVTFYCLVTHFQLGSEQLFALRGLNRALLMQVVSFDYYAIACGSVLGYSLKLCKINPVFVLSGFLMAPSLSLMLIAGGMIARMVTKSTRFEPFFAGIYSVNALMVLMRILF